MNERSLTVSIAAWFGSLINGPIVDRLGRKLSINLAVVVFVIGSAIQCGAVNIPMLFAGLHPFPDISNTFPQTTAHTPTGRAIAGVAVGQLTMVVPLYISEVHIHPPPHIQQNNHSTHPRPNRSPSPKYAAVSSFSNNVSIPQFHPHNHTH